MFQMHLFALQKFACPELFDLKGYLLTSAMDLAIKKPITFRWSIIFADGLIRILGNSNKQTNKKITLLSI